MTNEKVIIDLDTAITLLDRAVNENGHDYSDPNANEVSAGCVNVTREYTDEDGQPFDTEDGVLCPSCIAGHVFAYAGVPLEFLYAHNGTVNSTFLAINSDLSDEFEVTKEAAVVLRTAQRAQDDGKTWGDAMHAAQDIASVLREED